MKQLHHHRFLEVQGQQVKLVRKRIKNLNLSVRGHEGHVRVSAPMRTSERDIRRFVASRLGWIRKHQARLAKMSPQPEYEYASGELHPFLGRDYVLRVTTASSSRVVVNGENGDPQLH
ncbi:MAG: YgjP-like metallopeptidase domain-containing protein, partial [Salinisphaeraceae bacterium]|nr:YgjP-like metallopeptidase domain-containing protein [Salinisphaeraceae bacterium]